MTRSFPRRTLGVVAALLLASCFGDSTTGLRGSHRAQFAIAPLFDVRALDIVPFDHVRIRFVPSAGGAAVLDTVVAFPSTADTLALPLSVPVTGSSETFAITLAMINSAGDTVFRGGPSSATATPGTFAAAPTDIPIFYTGVGFDAASVRFTGTPPATAFFGDTAAFTAEALDSSGHPIAGTPVVFRVVAADSALARVADPAVGRVIAKTTRGSAHVVAELLTHQTATTPLLVQPRPSAIAFTAGSGQTGTVGAALPQPLTAHVTGADNLGVLGVVVTFAVTSGGGNLSATTDTTDVGGNASVLWTLGPGAGSQTVTASAGALTTSPVSAIAAPGSATKLAFAVQPSNATAGGALAPAVQVVAQDANGNTATSYTGNVTVTLSANPGGAALSGTVTVAAASGVASFGTLSLDKAAAGYTLAAAAAGLTGATSAPFNVTAGAAATLALFSGGAQFGNPGTQLALPVMVKVTDAFGNAVAGRAVTFAIATGAGSVGTPSANTGAAGTASTTWTLGPAGGPQSITATATGLAGSPLTIAATAQTGVPAKVAFLVQPTNTVSGFSITPAVQVAVQDSNGVTVPTFVGQVGIALVANPDTATLSGTFVVNAVAGIATFANLSVDKADTGYTLGAVAVSLIPAFSNRFTISAGAAKSIALVSGGGQTGAQSTLLALPVVVKVADSLGNGVSGKAVTFAVATGGGSVGTPNATTNALGLASTTWTLGAAAGAQSITAASAGLAGSPVTIGATAGVGIASTTVTPHRDTLTALTATVALAAQARDGLGNPMSGSFTWTSRTPSVATVSAAGLVTAVANDSTWVVAAEAGGTKDSALIVVQQRLASISVSGRSSLYLSTSFPFTAAAVDGLGHALPSNPAFTWSSTAPAVATVDTAGHVSAVGLGSAQIRATSGAITGVANLSVVTPIKRIAVVVDTVGSFKTDTVTLTSLGLTRRYRAIAHDTLDNVMTGIAFTWQSTNGSVALLQSFANDTATVVAAANGVTNVLATAQGFTSNPGAQLNVQQVLASIELKPDTTNPTATIAVGGTMHASARGKDANSRYIAGGTFKYHSSTPGVATVDSSTGLVTGVAVGAVPDTITATSGAITSNPLPVTVSNGGPAIISFGRDTVSVGRGSSAQIPILLSKPDTAVLTVNLGRSPAGYAHWLTASVPIPQGQTAVNATLVGDSAGTITVTASDGSGHGYTAASAIAKVTANMRLASSGYSINATDIVTTQVLLSDPSPAGGTYVTFNYSTAWVAHVSPDPAYIPAGQLAADIQILAVGAGSTTITPNAVGVNGQSSSFTAYAPVLTPNPTSIVLGQGQYYPNAYVQTPTYTNLPVPVTLTSSDTTVATVTPSTTITAGAYYAYFNVAAQGNGTATITLTAPGWTAAYPVTVTTSSPEVRICCSNGGLFTTSPQQNVTVYTADSTGTWHYRTNSLVVHLRSTDTSVVKVLDSVVTVQPGYYYNNSGRFVMGALGGTAWIVATASGHQPDSTQYTVSGPPLSASWYSLYYPPLVGVGQTNSGYYVSTPNYVTAPLVVTLTNSDTSVIGVPATVTIPTGSYYAYVTMTGKSPGVASIQATAPGYASAGGNFAVSPPRLEAAGSATVNNFSVGGSVYARSADTTDNFHPTTTPIAVTLFNTDTTKIRLDSTSLTIPAGQYYTVQPAHWTPLDTGTAKIIVSAAGYQSVASDTLTITVVTPPLYVNLGQNPSYPTLLGRRQHFDPSGNGFYVSTPDYRATPLPVTITQKHGTVDSLTTTAPTISSGTYYKYVDAYGLATGADTLTFSAPGYLPVTGYITVTSSRLRSSNLPGSTTTTNPPIGINVYATDSVGSVHYPMDTLVVAAVPSDSTVIQPAQRFIRIPVNQYYVSTSVNVVGPGKASMTYSDSAGTGYLPTTTDTMTVIGPSLSIYAPSMLGMRQHGGASSSSVSVPNSVAAPLVVHLLSTGARVATVPDSVIIPAGLYYAYFDVTAQDTVGTIQIQATATGYGGAATNVQVTPPKFVMGTSGQLNTTSSPTGITVYAEDQNGSTHYTTEDVTVTLASSATSVASVDSPTVTIPKDSYYNNLAHWTPGQVGTSQLSASDTRAAFYSYTAGAVNVTVITPTLTLYGPGTLGLGQYQDGSAVYTPDYQASAVAVTFTHTGTTRAGTFTNGTNTPITGVTIPQSGYYQAFRMAGLVRGTDTLTASVTSPAHNPATIYTVVDSGRVDPLGNWPGTITAGDSVLVYLYARDLNTNTHYEVTATPFTLAPNANIEFHQGGAVVTTVTIPADANYVTFYLVGKSAGSGSVTITNANYKTYSTTVTVQ